MPTVSRARAIRPAAARRCPDARQAQDEKASRVGGGAHGRRREPPRQADGGPSGRERRVAAAPQYAPERGAFIRIQVTRSDLLMPHVQKAQNRSTLLREVPLDSEHVAHIAHRLDPPCPAAIRIQLAAQPTDQTVHVPVIRGPVRTADAIHDLVA